VEGVGGKLNLPRRKGVGQRTKFSVNKHSDKPPPKAGQVVDAELISNQKAAFKTELPHLTGGGLTKQLQLKDNTAVSWANQETKSDKPTSPHNSN
jgi:hypothetical protein